MTLIQVIKERNREFEEKRKLAIEFFEENTDVSSEKSYVALLNMISRFFSPNSQDQSTERILEAVLEDLKEDIVPDELVIAETAEGKKWRTYVNFRLERIRNLITSALSEIKSKNNG